MEFNHKQIKIFRYLQLKKKVNIKIIRYLEHGGVSQNLINDSKLAKMATARTRRGVKYYLCNQFFIIKLFICLLTLDISWQ